jgi:hypothetical protein
LHNKGLSMLKKRIKREVAQKSLQKNIWHGNIKGLLWWSNEYWK